MNTISRAAYEGDIVSRLRNWRGLHLAHSGELHEEAANEIERLRARLCPYVTGSVTRYCTLTPFTLTGQEREAIAAGLGSLESLYADAPPVSRPIYDAHAPTLRGLLERTRDASK